jgi:hypothetical protein
MSWKPTACIGVVGTLALTGLAGAVQAAQAPDAALKTAAQAKKKCKGKVVKLGGKPACIAAGKPCRPRTHTHASETPAPARRDSVGHPPQSGDAPWASPWRRCCDLLSRDCRLGVRRRPGSWGPPAAQVPSGVRWLGVI